MGFSTHDANLKRAKELLNLELPYTTHIELVSLITRLEAAESFIRYEVDFKGKKDNPYLKTWLTSKGE